MALVRLAVITLVMSLVGCRFPAEDRRFENERLALVRAFISC
jgi:hypothetical protein